MNQVRPTECAARHSNIIVLVMRNNSAGVMAIYPNETYITSYHVHEPCRRNLQTNSAKLILSAISPYIYIYVLYVPPPLYRHTLVNGVRSYYFLAHFCIRIFTGNSAQIEFLVTTWLARVYLTYTYLCYYDHCRGVQYRRVIRCDSIRPYNIYASARTAAAARRSTKILFTPLNYPRNLPALCPRTVNIPMGSKFSRSVSIRFAS